MFVCPRNSPDWDKVGSVRTDCKLATSRRVLLQREFFSYAAPSLLGNEQPSAGPFTANLSSWHIGSCRKLTFEADQKDRGRSGPYGCSLYAGGPGKGTQCPVNTVIGNRPTTGLRSLWPSFCAVG